MLFNGEIGVVQSADHHALNIRFTEGDACETCGLKVVCAPGKSADRSLSLPNPDNLSVGQTVQIEELSNLELHLALIQFGLPLLAFLMGLGAGIVIPQAIVPKEFMSFLIGLFGLGISFFMARHLVGQITTLIPEKYLRVVPVNQARA